MEEFSDVLLVEDVAATVEGLELDLQMRGAAVRRVPDAEAARTLLTVEEWSGVLFDVRIPERQGEEPSIEAGLALIRDTVHGLLGSAAADAPFGIITLQVAISEVEEFIELPTFLGFFSKNEDTRRLFRVLEEKRLVSSKLPAEKLEEGADDRQAVKYMVLGLTDDGRCAVVEAPSVGDGKCLVDIRKFLPSVRRRLYEGHVPFYVRGTGNVRDMSVITLDPSDFGSQIEEVGEPIRLDHISSGGG